MTDQSAQEPTMEEILASIRRIISEDDAPAVRALRGGQHEAHQRQRQKREREYQQWEKA